MIEHKNISPLLDGLSLGNPVGDHFGICCYPAIREDSDRKYIVKIISLPAAQSQLDALLITGAYQDAAEAAEYYREQAEQTLKEAELLAELSQENGFVAFEGSQMEPMEKGRIGYEVCFLSGFRLSLNRYMHRKTISHLDAVNLGIDICGALAAARKAGMLYIALKPANIFISARKQFRIGDLGFAPLDSLRFTSMPEKYRSPYTAPELLDDLNTLNTTADTYALGMILYQIFNNGQLPQNLSEHLPAPAAADDDMARILCRACSPIIEERWESPEQMGQALRDYLQGGTVDDSPILPPLPGRAADRTVRLFDISQTAAQEPEKEPEQEAGPVSETVAEPVAEVVPEPEVKDEEKDAAPVLPDTEAAEQAAPEEDAIPAEESAEPAAGETTEPPVSEAVAEEFAQAVATHFSTFNTSEEPAAEPTLSEQELDTELKTLNTLLRPEPPKKKKRKKEPHVTPVVMKPKKKHHVVRNLVVLLLLAMLAAAGIWGYLFYTEEYIQPVRSIQITGTNSSMTVYVDSDVKDGLLNAVCTDPVGHYSQTKIVRNGQAEFTDLSPDSMYTVHLVFNGFGKLQGPTSDTFFTEAVTSVATFTVAMGSTNGSVILNLTTEGHEPDQWQVIYTAPGEAELGHTFTGHNTTVNNLVLGKEYTFTLQTGDHKEVAGQTTCVFTPMPIVKAKDLAILSCNDGILTAVWDAPAGSENTVWRVRCSGVGYEQTIETEFLTASFTGIDPNAAYTVEVTAVGMTQSETVKISANPITLTDFRVVENDPETMTVSWDFSGAAPADGWVLQYTLDDGYLPTAVRVSGPSAVVESKVPDAEYHFTVLTTTDTSVFNGLHVYQAAKPASYTGHSMPVNCMSVKMLLDTPDTEGWTYEGALRLGYAPKTVFSPDDHISVVLTSLSGFYLGTEGSDIIHIMFVYRDEQGNILTELLGETDKDWYRLWFDEDYHNCELDVPTTPMNPGNYTLTIYFNGLLAASTGLTIN